MVKSMKIKIESKIYRLVLVAVFILTVLLICVSMRNNSPTKLSPRSQPNTSWASDSIYFSIDSDLKCLGILETESDSINVEILFGKGRDNSITIEDYDAKVREGFVFNSERYLISGECEFEKDSFIVKVTESKIGSIHKGDEITFRRTDRQLTLSN